MLTHSIEQLHPLHFVTPLWIVNILMLSSRPPKRIRKLEHTRQCDWKFMFSHPFVRLMVLYIGCNFVLLTDGWLNFVFWNGTVPLFTSISIGNSTDKYQSGSGTISRDWFHGCARLAERLLKRPRIQSDNFERRGNRWAEPFDSNACLLPVLCQVLW